MARLWLPTTSLPVKAPLTMILTMSMVVLMVHIALHRRIRKPNLECEMSVNPLNRDELPTRSEKGIRNIEGTRGSQSVLCSLEFVR